jgi:hypothetical protein
MTNETASDIPVRKRLLILFAFLVCVNLLAGYVAITLDYESLYTVKAKFGEYALPLPFCWGFVHIPSMFLYGSLLALLPGAHKKYVGYFRIFCVASFALLLLEMGEKIPFLLFPKIDALTALLFSLIVVPPNRKENPVLVAAIKLSGVAATLLLGYLCYSFWAHLTPRITTTRYQDGAFELRSISIKADFHKRMTFEVDLTTNLAEDQLCVQAQSLAMDLLRDYPFDDSYTKRIDVRFNVPAAQSGLAPYPLGMLELEDRARQEDGSFFCYLKYKTSASR